MNVGGEDQVIHLEIETNHTTHTQVSLLIINLTELGDFKNLYNM